MALVICPDCKTKVSTDAFACPKCGRPKVRNGVSETWKKDGLTPGGVIGGVVILVLLFVGFKACVSWLNSGPTFLDKKYTIASGSVSIPAGQVSYYKFEIKPEFQDVDVKGNFTASGGSGNDIYTFIASESDVINWKNGHKYQVFWQTDGQQTTGNFDVKLQPGAYYLVLSNRFSVESDKQVAIDAAVTFKEPVAKN